VVTRALRAALGMPAPLLLSARVLSDPSLSVAVLFFFRTVLVMSNICVIVVGYAMVRRFDVAFPCLGPRNAVVSWRCFLLEVSVRCATFLIPQASEHGRMGNERVGPPAPGRIPVRLILGYLCNRALWCGVKRP